MKLKLLAVVFLGLVGCSRAVAAKPYPADIARNFVAECSKSAPKQFCECALKESEKHYTLGKFLAMDQEIRNTGKVPPDYIEKMAVCRR